MTNAATSHSLIVIDEHDKDAGRSIELVWNGIDQFLNQAVAEFVLCCETGEQRGDRGRSSEPEQAAPPDYHMRAVPGKNSFPH